MNVKRTGFPKIGLALGSGSAKGLAHIGVLKVLEKHNIPIDYIAGSSIGAMIGAYYARNPTIIALEELIYKISERKLSSILDITMKGGIIKGMKIEKLLEETLEGASFDTMKVPFAAVATDLSNADMVTLTGGDLIKAIRASISIPGFLRPLEYKGRILADGGLSNPVPVDVVAKMGADIVIGVNLDTLYVKDGPVSIPPLTRIPSRSVNILRHHLALKSTRSSDVIISPLVYSGMISWRDFFTRSRLEEFIAEGERAAEKALPQIIEKIEYFRARPPSLISRLGGRLLRRVSHLIPR